jgi:hypothetical protein
MKTQVDPIQPDDILQMHTTNISMQILETIHPPQSYNFFSLCLKPPTLEKPEELNPQKLPG